MLIRWLALVGFCVILDGVLGQEIHWKTDTIVPALVLAYVFRGKLRAW